MYYNVEIKLMLKIFPYYKTIYHTIFEIKKIKQFTLQIFDYIYIYIYILAYTSI